MLPQRGTHLGSWVDLVQVVDELCQVLNGVDVVVWGRADQWHAGLAAAQVCNVRRHLLARQLATLSWLGTLVDWKRIGLGVNGIAVWFWLVVVMGEVRGGEEVKF